MSDRVPNWLAHWARARPAHAAVIDGGQSISFAELAARAAGASERLRRLGIGRGDRVAVLMGGGAAFVEIMHGLMRLGAVLVPLNGRLSPAEIAQQLTDCGARLLVHDTVAPPLVAGVRAVAAAEVIGPEPGSAGDDWPPLDLSAVHSIIYTSGSSGRPKGVLLTVGNYLWSALGSAVNLGVHGDDRWLACLPFCHVGGLSILLRSVIYGTTVVLHDGFDPERVNRAIDVERVTIVSVVANMLQRMLEARGERPYPTWLRCVLLGGGPAPPSLLQACAARGVPVLQTYGLTEAASQVTTLAPQDAVRKLGSAGTPLLMTEVRITKGDEPVASGKVGEILVRGPTVSPGYVNQDGAPRDPDGWLHTGDLGRVDAEGFLYVVGRRDDLIISGGENIYPAEVEAVLRAHLAVAEACVVGAPDPHWGEAVVAWVQVRSGRSLDADELAAHARRFLAKFKVPRQIRFVDDFPRTAAGKIRRRQVRAAVRGD